MLRVSLAEIADAELTAGEEEELKQKIERLTHSEDLLHAAQGARDQLLGAGEGLDASGVAAKVGGARRRLAAVMQHDAQLEADAKRGAAIGYLVADLGVDLA